MTDQDAETVKNTRCLLLFAREPVPGKVKTRMIPALGEAGAARLYKALLAHQLKLVERFSTADCQLWVDGDTGHEDFSEFTGHVYQQVGENIGERMDNALTQSLRKYQSAVLIGCDCPGFSTDYLERAFAALDENNDVVLGPAVDGGYVLIGLKQSMPQVFKGVSWGSAWVMEQTRLQLRAHGLTWRELEALHDIDDPADLVHLGNAFGGYQVEDSRTE